jgi:hypothetical protein
MERVQTTNTNDASKRKGERGAALVTTLLVSMLLLAAGGALILTTSLSATNSVDSNAESQAYYAAEAGLQESLNVLRGNSSIINPAFTFATAGDRSVANKTADNATTYPYSRLSNWLSYSTAYPDRVTLTSNYSPLNGLAYSVRVTAPDAENIPIGNNGNKIDTFNKSDLPPGATPMATPSWHQWHCGHCSWQYSHHDSCTHKHCTNPNGTGRATVDDTRLLIQSTGYGPKGAIKNMEMIVKRTMFDYNDAAAVVTLVGPSDNTAPMSFAFSQDKDHAYKGTDLFGGSTTKIAAFGFTSSTDQGAANTYIAAAHNGTKVVDDVKTILLDSNSIPAWYMSADDARVFLAELQSEALMMGRYFTTSTPPAANTYGTDTTAVFTFVDGDFTVPDGKKGGGLLVVTGTLTFAGTGSWDGLVLVMGDDPSGNAAKFRVTLNKNAYLHGAMVIAPFHRAAVTGSPFLSPSFDNSAGGDTIFQYDSGEVRDAIYTIPPKVIGVHEGLTVTPSN